MNAKRLYLSPFCYLVWKLVFNIVFMKQDPVPPDVSKPTLRGRKGWAGTVALVAVAGVLRWNSFGDRVPCLLGWP